LVDDRFYDKMIPKDIEVTKFFSLPVPSVSEGVSRGLLFLGEPGHPDPFGNSLLLIKIKE
tara:strand:- start:222 stop:401 length:180 start_codon:yes stop_codon:yes gene_type:complete